MYTNDIETTSVAEDEIVNDVEKIVSKYGSYAMWIVGVTDDPLKRRELRGACNWKHWDAGDADIAKKVCDQFKSKGMAFDPASDHSAATYVYVF